MKPVNIYSLCEIFQNVDCTQENKVSKINELLIKYFKKQTKNDPKERFIKDVEIDSLKTFCNFIIKHSKNRINKDIDLFNNFYFGYIIPQIGEEYDLLKFSNNCIINIELKYKSTNNEILKQLQQHYYYLKFIGKENIVLFTFVCKDNLLYKYDIKNDKIIEESGDNLIKILKENNICDNNIDIDNLFKPSNYLVSVFNSTEKFITDEYFLTNQQKNIKRDIIKSIDDNIDNNNFFLISGGAGTGKTLLLYDCAKEFIKKGKNTLIIHVGNLNEGHIRLKNNNWNIISIKDIKLEDKSILEDNYYDVIIIDEIQRIRKEQFKAIIEYVKEKNIKCIMAGDQKQVFTINENGYELINYNELNIKKFELRDTIRTNENILNFQKKLFDNIEKYKDISIDSKNINIVYFNDKEYARSYIENKINYKFINYTPTQFPNDNTIDIINYFNKTLINKTLTSHSVIGQEFDNVIIFMDDYFCYDEKNKLQEKKRCGNPYIQLKMLYQNITRTKHNLEIVIIDNFELYEKILEIF